MLGFREAPSQKGGFMAWRVFHAIPRQAWATARQIADALGDSEITSLDVASEIRAKLIPLYVKKRPDPDGQGVPRRYRYQ